MLLPLEDDVACKFVGDYLQVNALLNFDKPVTHGVQTEQDWHFEHKAKQHAALMGSKKVILETFAQFKELTGREYKLVESYGIKMLILQLYV
jgi:pyruvate ferredoxin oxidoreductase alpha subunit